MSQLAQGLPSVFSLLSERYQFGSKLGVLAHKAGGDQVCHRGGLLAPRGRGGSEIFAFVSLPSHRHLQHVPIFSSDMILYDIENVKYSAEKI